jgi:hypothetical protein
MGQLNLSQGLKPTHEPFEAGMSSNLDQGAHYCTGPMILSDRSADFFTKSSGPEKSNEL